MRKQHGALRIEDIPQKRGVAQPWRENADLKIAYPSTGNAKLTITSEQRLDDFGQVLLNGIDHRQRDVAVVANEVAGKEKASRASASLCRAAKASP